MGVQKEATAAIATVTTKGSGGRPSAVASEITTGANSATVAASDIICVSHDTMKKMAIKIQYGSHGRTTLARPSAIISEMPLVRIARPSGIAPAMNTKIR